MTPSIPPRNSSLRILITRLSHIGDCVVTLPLANALRTHFPNAYVAWVVERPSQQLLEGHAAIDKMIVLPRGWAKSWRVLGAVRRELRELNVDVAIDPQSLTKSSLLAWLSGARRRIGFARGQGRELALWLNNERVVATQPHIVDRTLELLQPLGVPRPEVRFELPDRADANDRADEIIRQMHLGCGFAMLSPGAGWPSKQWIPARFGKVARQVSQQHSLPSLIVWAGEEEKRMAGEIAESSGGQALVAPATSLTELAALLRRARLFIGSDSGPMHIAAAVGTQCVALFGPTRYENVGAYGQQHVYVQKFYQAGSSTERRHGKNLALQAITVEDVCAACDEALTRAADVKAA